MAVEILYTGKHIKILKSDNWEYVERVNKVDAAIIVPIFVDDSCPESHPDRFNLILIREFRVPLQQYSYGLPAGLVGDNDNYEDPVDAAYRELEEETGYVAERMRYLTSGPPSSGLSNERLHFYLADKLTHVTSDVGVNGEDITVHKVPISNVDEWIRTKAQQGYAIDPKVFLGLYFANKYIDNLE